MKKLLGILVLGYLLTGCQSFHNVQEGKTYDMRIIYANFAVKRYHEGYRFFAVAYTSTKGEIIFSGSNKNIETARSNTIEHCNREWKVNDCYVFESWDLSNIDIENVAHYVLWGFIPKKNIQHKKREIDITKAKTKCKEMGFLETDDEFKHCVLKVVEIISDEKSVEKVELENNRQLLLLKEIRESQKRQRKREKHWQGIKQMDRILNKGSAF